MKHIDNDDKRIHHGLGMLLSNDHYLLAHDLNERSITHKLGEHYQSIFPEWNVDCEFNRNMGELKKIVIDPQEILRQMANSLESNSYFSRHELMSEDIHGTQDQMRSLERQLRDPGRIIRIEELDLFLFLLDVENGKTITKYIFPDIIIHHRGTPDNHIVIEAKKTSGSTYTEKMFDILKLIALTTSPDFHYRRGYFMDLPVLADLSIFKEFSESIKMHDAVYKMQPVY